jgi:hypothetical protein
MTDTTPNEQASQTAPNEPTNSEAKFTQADIDRILAERLSRAKESTRKELLGEFGVDNPDTLKEALKKAKEREEAEMSESQKLQKQLEIAQKANALLSEEKQNLLNAQRIERRNSAIITAAQEAKAIDPSDVVAWATGQSELIDATLKEDGTTDTAAVKKLIDAAKKAKPHFFTSSGVGSPSNAHGRVPKASTEKVVGKRPFGNL